MSFLLVYPLSGPMSLVHVHFQVVEVEPESRRTVVHVGLYVGCPCMEWKSRRGVLRLVVLFAARMAYNHASGINISPATTRPQDEDRMTCRVSQDCIHHDP